MNDKVATIKPLGIWEGSAGNQHPAPGVTITGVQAARGEWFFGFMPKSEGEYAFVFLFDNKRLENVNQTVFGAVTRERVARDMYEPLHFHVPHAVCTTPGEHKIEVLYGYMDEAAGEFKQDGAWIGSITITDPVMEQ